MQSLLSSSAAAASASSTAPAAPLSKFSDKNVKKPGKKKYSSGYFIALSEDISTADIKLDAEVFSGFEMVVLLLDEIEDFMRTRHGSIKDVTRLFARRGLELSERTVKDYITKARKLRKEEDTDKAVAKLRESIFESARKSGKSPADRAADCDKSPLSIPQCGKPAGGTTPAAGTIKDASATTSSTAAPAATSAAASSTANAPIQDAAADTMADAGDFCLPDAGWLSEAVSQAMDSTDRLEAGHASGLEGQRTASGTKSRAGRKHSKRRPHRH